MAKQPLRQEEIQDLINSNEALKFGYETFKKEHPRRKIYDMYTRLSNSGKYPDEVYIKYEINHQIETFYCEVFSEVL
jgi:hypothetical protein